MMSRLTSAATASRLAKIFPAIVFDICLRLAKAGQSHEVHEIEEFDQDDGPGARASGQAHAVPPRPRLRWPTRPAKSRRRAGRQVAIPNSKFNKSIVMANEKILTAIRSLRVRLAKVDERSTRARLASRGIKAKLIQSRDRITLRIYKEKNHRLPHFHIEFKKQYSASYAIATGECLAGDLPKKYEKTMLSWAVENSGLLQREWDKLNSDRQLEVSLKASQN
jgi:hypothetical protein